MTTDTTPDNTTDFIDKELLSILVCPGCKGELEVVTKGSTGSGKGSTDGSGLACAGCALLYPIKDGIPVMLVDEALPLKPGATHGVGNAGNADKG